MDRSDVYDSRGYPIYPGDVLRTKHFRGRRRTYWLIHVAAMVDGRLRMLPARWADPAAKHDGGDPLLTQGLANEATIIEGGIVGDWVVFTDRPRRRKVANRS